MIRLLMLGSIVTPSHTQFARRRPATKLHGKSLLAGALGATGGRTFRAENPATGEPLSPIFHEASAADVAAALDASAAAFAGYRTCHSITRAHLLDTIAAEIEHLGDVLLRRARAETGLPLALLTHERDRTCAQLRLFAQVAQEGSWVDARIDPGLPQRQPLPRPDVRRMLIPLGPVVVFGSSNFPRAFSVAGGDTASALAAGCTVVVKAHPGHPGTSELVGGAVVRALAACRLPAGVFSMLQGEGATVGVAMVKHPATVAAGFTCSEAAGPALFAAVASRPHPIPVFAEMSSLNPVFLFPGAVRERARDLAQDLFDAFTFGAGQFCTKPGLIFAVRDAATDVFLERLGELVRAAPNATMQSGAIRDSFLASRARIASGPDVRVWAAGEKKMDAVKTEVGPIVAFTEASYFLINRHVAVEAFGPFVLIILANKLNEFAACADALEGQLTATVHASATELAKAGALISILEQKAGRVLLNEFPPRVEVCPAMHHGGPYPATSDARFTSVGTAAMLRFARPVCYQNLSEELLPAALKSANPLGLLRLVNGQPTRAPIGNATNPALGSRREHSRPRPEKAPLLQRR